MSEEECECYPTHYGGQSEEVGPANDIPCLLLEDSTDDWPDYLFLESGGRLELEIE